MKLQITFDLTNLEKAITVAPSLAHLVDAIEVGSLLLYKHGEKALFTLRELLPDKALGADTKIVDQAKETVTLLVNAGADWVTVMAGTKNSIVHAACSTAGNMGKKAFINFLDAASIGQAALEAKSLGGDAVIFSPEQSQEDRGHLQETWEMIKGNTVLPIYLRITATPENLDKVIPLDPYGLIINLTESTIDSAPEFINTVRSRLTQ